MSPSQPNFEQLLSSYLDGAATPHERAVVEAHVAKNPEIARDLAEMRRLIESIAAADFDREAKLPRQFADQVVEAAIERARLEGHPDDHPLLRSATQPLGPAVTGTTSRHRDRRWVAAAGAGLAVAASTLLAISMWRSQPDAPNSDHRETMFALADLPESLPKPENFPNDAAPSGLAETNDNVAGQRTDEAAMAPKLTPKSASEITPEAAMIADARPETPRLAPELASMPSPVVEPTVVRPPAVESLAADTPAMVSSSLKAVMVIRVKLVNASAGLSPVREAMRTAGVDRDSQQPLNQSIVSAIADAVDEANPSGSLMYLRAPAKQIDRFILTLQNDPNRVEGVQLGIATDARVVDVAGQMVDADATDVRQEFAGIVSAKQIARLGDQLRETTFVPWDAASGAMMAVSNNDSGPDVMSHLFVLVGG